MDRRNFLLASALSTVGAAGLSACGGSGESGAERNSSSAALLSGPTWDVAPVLVAGAPQVVFDLNATLPAGVRNGGQFSVSPSGTPLPGGVVLSSTGVLSVTSAATPGVTQGIVFVYAEPPA
jgi:hypothetical protein